MASGHLKQGRKLETMHCNNIMVILSRRSANGYISSRPTNYSYLDPPKYRKVVQLYLANDLSALVMEA